MQEYINLLQEGMNVKEYIHKFTKLFKYVSTMMANSRTKMNKFVMGISNLEVNECRSAMLTPSMDISRLMFMPNKLRNKSLSKLVRN